MVAVSWFLSGYLLIFVLSTQDSANATNSNAQGMPIPLWVTLILGVVAGISSKLSTPPLDSYGKDVKNLVTKEEGEQAVKVANDRSEP